MYKPLALIFMVVLFAGACGDDENDTTNVRERLENAAGNLSARAAAEAMRIALETEDLDGGETLRDVAVLRENADDVPDDPVVEGITDANGDGKDDDGKVEFRVGDQAACVTVSVDNDVSVTSDPCS